MVPVFGRIELVNVRLNWVGFRAGRGLSQCEFYLKWLKYYIRSVNIPGFWEFLVKNTNGMYIDCHSFTSTS